MKHSKHKEKTQKKSSAEKLKEAKRKNLFKDNMALLFIVGILVIVGIAIALNSSSAEKEKENLVYGDDEIVMHYFHSSTCPHCHKQNAFHPQILAQYPNVNIIEYEISRPDSQQKLREIAALYPDFDLSRFGTPTTFVGEEFNIGYGTDATSGQVLLNMVQKEQERIEASWDDSTMTRTIDLRAQLLQ